MLKGVFGGRVNIHAQSLVMSLCFEVFSFLSCLYVTKVMLYLNRDAYSMWAQIIEAYVSEALNRKQKFLPRKHQEVTTNLPNMIMYRW